MTAAQTTSDTLTAAGDLRLERLLPGPIDRVWAYLTDSEKRRTWFASGEIEPRVGGKADLFFQHHGITEEAVPEPYREMMEKGVASPERVSAYDPPRKLGYTFGGGEVTFELTPAGGDVRLVLTQTRASKGEEGGWLAHLYALGERLAGRKPDRFWAKIMEHRERG